MNTKTKQQHTPGPWRITKQNFSRTGTALEGQVTAVQMSGPCDVLLCSLGAQPDEVLANARVISAAPAMLAALKALFEHCAMTHKHWGEGSNRREADAAIAAGLAAIAKAEGQQ